MPRRAFRFTLLLSILFCGPALAQTYFRVDPSCPAQEPLTITFDLTQEGPVQLVVTHVFTNQYVRTLLDDFLVAGRWQTTWDGKDVQGQDVEPGVYVFTLSGGDWQTDMWGSIDCGNDAAIQSRVAVGGRDVSMILSSFITPDIEVEQAIYAADGVTRLTTLAAGPSWGWIGTWWTLTDSLQNRLPAGDYIFRTTSSVYSEDIPFALNPIEQGVLEVTVTDGTGSRVTGVTTGIATAPILKGPLQQMEIACGRRMSAAEITYLLDGGLQFHGLFEYAAPDSATVWPDSTGLTYEGFRLHRPWPDIIGGGSVRGVGMFEPETVAFRYGYDHEGVTWRNETCASTGPVDAGDWNTNPGPFYTTATGTIDPPCNNPVPVGQAAGISFTLAEPGFVYMTVSNSDGDHIRNLVADELGAGFHFVQWDRLDQTGFEVPAGIYHLVWHGRDVDHLKTVASGDIWISPYYSAVPDDVVGPGTPRLFANHPNPFNPTTSLSFELPAPAFARLTVLSVDGKRVATLLAERVGAGPHAVTWNGRDHAGRAVSSGTYFYRLEAGSTVQTRSMMLLK